MRILGIETSCDETAVAILDDGNKLQSNLLSSQAHLHERFGGVVPEIASRAHLENINPLIELALRESGASISSVDGVAVTVGPGLVGALLVGIAAAKGVALGAAAGEAFDKIARFMGLGFPGGPALDRLAAQGDPRAIRFPRAATDRGYDFSLSGLKTAVVRHLKVARTRGEDPNLEDVAASFQEAVVEVQVAKTIAAATDRDVKTVVLGGGVVANTRLRQLMSERADQHGLELLIPPPELCTDNAAMIACAGHHRLVRGERTPLDIGADPGLPLS